MPKFYDQAYFDHWYRDPQYAVRSERALWQRVQVDLAVAEYFLGRSVQSVLDVGCGEGAWRAPLLALRPELKYRGVDASSYAVARFGVERGLQLGRFAELAQLDLDAPVDLLICADVMHYLDEAELLAGLQAFSSLCHGVALLDVMHADEHFIGDHAEFVARSEATYRRLFADAGWHHAAPRCYLAASKPSSAE